MAGPVIFEFTPSFDKSIPEWGWKNKWVAQIGADELRTLYGPLAAHETLLQIFHRHQGEITSRAAKKLRSLSVAPEGPLVMTLSDFEN